MLFDLRSRGRRRTVQTIYIGLAALIGLGLIGFGVGTGSGGGGIFGAFSNSSSSNPQSSIANQQTKAAVKRTQQHPTSAAAWSQLINARFSAANSTGYNSNTNTYTTAGKQQLALVTPGLAALRQADEQARLRHRDARRALLRPARPVQGRRDHLAGGHPVQPRQRPWPGMRDPHVLRRQEHARCPARRGPGPRQDPQGPAQDDQDPARGGQDEPLSRRPVLLTRPRPRARSGRLGVDRSG